MSQVPRIELNDGVTIPQLGLGVWRMDAADTKELVLAALEIGYRHIDCAALYANEAEVGEAIGESGLAREEVFVTSKVWNDRHRDCADALAESLEKFGYDYFDLFLIHWPVPSQDLYVDVWHQLIDAREAGTTRSIGVSNFQPTHLRHLVDATGVVPSVNQIELHPSFTQADVVAANRELGIGTEVWRPLGREDLESDVVTAIAADTDRSPAQVVIRWHLQHGYIVFPKSAHQQRLAENFDVFGFTLSDQQIAAIDALNTNNRYGGDPDTFTGAGY